MIIKIANETYEVATTLRVPYEIQKKFGNKPYTKVFEGLSDSTLEEQIRFIYVAFNIANKDKYTLDTFQELLLDNWNLDDIMNAISDLMDNLLGGPKEDDSSKKAEES